MRYLLLINIAVAMLACAGPYTHLHNTGIANKDCLEKHKPDFKTALYNTKVNVVGKHLSGLLIIKQMPDSSMRIVFSNEAGFKFFDFGFLNDDFKVYYIYDAMNKKAVIKTLRKDFELVMMSGLASHQVSLLKNDHQYYYSFQEDNDHYYYITDSSCQEVLRMERGTGRKPVMTAIAQHFVDGIPDTIGISHSNFSFEIGLKRIYNYAER